MKGVRSVLVTSNSLVILVDVHPQMGLAGEGRGHVSPGRVDRVLQRAE